MVLAIVAGAGSRTATLRQLVVDTLEDRLDSDVELESFSVDTFPTVHITGTGLVLRLKSRPDVPPLVTIRSFALDGGADRAVRASAALQDRHAHRPAGEHSSRRHQRRRRWPTAAARPSVGRAAIVIEKLIADDAVLALIPRKAGKSPRVFAVHRLTMDSLGEGTRCRSKRRLPTRSRKGWSARRARSARGRRAIPAARRCRAAIRFDDVDLSTVKGIAGTLSSTGEFGGQLDRIDVRAKRARRISASRSSGNPVPLQTKFEAVVDGTDGDTYLNAVSATFLRHVAHRQGRDCRRRGGQGTYGERPREDRGRSDRGRAAARREGDQPADDRPPRPCTPT